MSGRATLISSVLGSVSIHTLSILPVPKVVIKGIERLMRNFLWDRGGSAKHHWVNWDQVCMPKDEGGLGIRKLSDVKKCLFNKLAWRFLQNNSIWAKFARKKYLHKSYSSAIWSSLKPYIRKMRQDSCWEIGKGDVLLSHFCEWLNVKLPKHAESWTIKDVVNSDTIKDSFNSMISGITPNVIDSFHLSNSPDRLCWKEGSPGSSSIFTTKASYDKIRKSMPKNNLFANSWQAWLPTKISVFLWRLWHKALPTDDNITRCGICVVSKCWCCQKSKVEATEHLFLHSDIASSVWAFLAVNLDKPTPGDMEQLKRDWFIDLKRGEYMSSLSLCLAAVTLWEFTLDKLNIPTPENHMRGRWKKWSPSSSGLTLSISTNKNVCGGILRDCKGTMVMGFKVNLEHEDLSESIISACLLMDEEGWLRDLACIQSSHPDSNLFGADNFMGTWPYFSRWREARRLIGNARFKKINPELNNAAIALCFQETSDSIYYRVQAMPKAVRVAVTADYIQLPTWCRTSSKAPFDAPLTLLPGTPWCTPRQRDDRFSPYI
ncbi:hypothetical protein QQ045_009353 [Rhodiola kirilowii]